MEKRPEFRKGYHDLLRPEILALIPNSAQRILDLGCGTGKLGEALKKRQECVVNGIEIDESAADEARKVMNTVLTHDLNFPVPRKYSPAYDCIVFGDILEHTYNPWGLLKQIAKKLKPDGVIIASIPNVAHPSIVQDLIRGQWRYQDAGILDITHLRFFTKTSISQMFITAGLKIKDIRPHPTEKDKIQYIITAKRKKEQAIQPIVTLLMLSLNTWEYTRQAIKSIFAHTTVPFKLLVIDQGSSDDTIRHLRWNDELYHIEHALNIGFAAGFNSALSFVDTPYFALLNSDIVVTDGWLKRMVDTIKAVPEIAIVGPRSNYVSGPQLDKLAKYKDIDEMHKYAGGIRNTEFAKFHSVPRIVFFCTLLKSQLLQEIGGLDERFGIGNFEDDDYCRRVIQKGYRCVIDDSVFVHHYGSQTFKANNIDYKKSMETNLQKFNKKWGLS